MAACRALPLLLWALATGCSEQAGPWADLGPGPHSYDGDFECSEIDADTARMVWDADAGIGSFGWIPSNGVAGVFVTMPITSLSFDVIFASVTGLDRPQVAETVRLRFQLSPSDGGRAISGPGILTRASGQLETCSARFHLRTDADAGS